MPYLLYLGDDHKDIDTVNILMFTNTYLPHVGGVARSVDAFATEFRSLGHRVLIVAPEFPGQPDEEKDVVRVPALQRFNGSDFSVKLPIPPSLYEAIEAFNPDVVHAHHPFLLGGTALRFARERDVPLIFTHHTMYEQYTHYVPGDSDKLKQFVINLASGYCNLCDAVFAPSQSVHDLLRERDVTSTIHVVPTGVKRSTFARGSGLGMRMMMGIPEDAFVIGHIGRLAPEKGLDVVASAVRQCLDEIPNAHFLLAGDGPSLREIKTELADSDRFHHCGVVAGDILVSTYKAMDVFVFASLSETQGMVMSEAMAAGVPVVAFDAPGVREVVDDRKNGRLLDGHDPAAMAEAIHWIHDLGEADRESMRANIEATAERFSMAACAELAIKHYEEAMDEPTQGAENEDSNWDALTMRIKAEWEIISNAAEAVRDALREP